MTKRMFLAALSLLFSAAIFSQSARADLLKQQLLDPNSNKVLVVAHRGDWRGAPENSLQAMKNCIAMGVDMVEIDLKMTKDSVLILLHDKTIDRTLSGKGKPADYTLAELRAMRLRNGAGHPTEHVIPTFEECMKLCKGEILVNVDKGYDYFSEVYRILQMTGTIEQCVIKSGKSYSEVRAEQGDVLDKVIFMPIVKTSHPELSTFLKEYEKNLRPVAYELVFDREDHNLTLALARIKSSGSSLWINSLWADLCAGRHDDRAVEQNQPEETWGWMIQQGAKLIQTDRPSELLRYLSSKGLHD